MHNDRQIRVKGLIQIFKSLLNESSGYMYLINGKVDYRA